MPDLEFMLHSGTLAVTDGQRSLEIIPEVCWRDPSGKERIFRPLNGNPTETRVDGLRLETSHEEFSFVLEIASDEGFAIVRARLIPADRQVFSLGKIRWITRRADGFPPAAALVRRSLPYDVWGRCGIFPMTETTPDNRVEYWRCAVHPEEATDQSLLFTVNLPARWLHRFTVEEGETLLETLVEASLAPGESFENDPLAIKLNGDLDRELGGPSRFHALRLPPSAGPVHAGWNSWDAYRLTVTEDDILENLEELQRYDWLRNLVRYVIVDDGWEDKVGEWEANEKFPHGMKWLADRITAAGFVPGMWAAPFFAEPGSRIFDEHPEFCVQYEGRPYSPFALVGCESPWGDRAYLDPTRPEVADHIYRQWRKFHDWGYRYFKTDFLANSWKLPGRNTGPAQPPDKPEPDFGGRLGLYNRGIGLHCGHRRCMAAIRAAIGEESFWLGCGSIWATGAGLMDASRVSGDIDIKWDNLVKCGRNAFLNQHAHGRIWLNDPDFLVVRGKETATPEQLEDFKTERNESSKPAYPDSFTLDEARMWAAIVALSGGMVVLSDRLKWLNEEGLGILKTLAPFFSGAPGKVLEWQGDLPRVVLQNSPKGRLLGMFNWTDETVAPLEAAEASGLPDGPWKELWSGTSVNTSAALAELHLPAHACALLSAG